MESTPAGTDSSTDGTGANKDFTLSWGYIRLAVAFLLRAGYIAVQIGCIPAENVYTILLKNILEIAVTIISYGFMGYMFACSKSTWLGLIGYGRWINSKDINLEEAIIGFSTCIIATAIITTILAGRVRILTILLITFVYASFAQPIIMHWVVHKEGWIATRTLFKKPVKVRDYGGCLPVHISSGLVGFIGALFLGRRLLIIDAIDPSSMGVDAPISTFVGYIMIIVGYLTMAIPVKSSVKIYRAGLVLINNMMAIGAGILTVLIIHVLIYRRTSIFWTSLLCVQGALAALVSISSGVDGYLPMTAFMIATISTVIFYFVAMQLRFTCIEDDCNIITSHLICGYIGALLAPLCDNYAKNLLGYFVWQMVAIVGVTAFIGIIFGVLFTVLYFTKILRNVDEVRHHELGVCVANIVPKRCFCQRLFRVNTDTHYIEPGKKNEGVFITRTTQV